MDDLRPPPIRNPSLSFGLVYLLLVGVYGLYSWGIYSLMEDVIMKGRDCDRKNPISLFVVFFGGIVLFISNRSEVEKEKEKISAFVDTVNAYSSLIESLKISLRPFQNRDPFITLGTTLMSRKEAIYEITMCYMMSILIIYMDQIMGMSTNTVENLLGTLAIYDYKPKSTGIFTTINTKFGLTACTLARQKLLDINAADILDYRVVMGPVTTVIDRARILQNMDLEGTFWWINYAVRVFGILYLFSVPFLLWINSGEMSILWSVVVFVLFGSIIFYRYYIGDSFRNPTKWGVGNVNVLMFQLAKDADMFIASLPSTSGETQLILFDTFFGKRIARPKKSDE